MTNIIALFGFLIKLMPFLKEVFLKNKDFREAILSNRSMIGVFFACIVLFALNLDHIDTLMQNQQKIRELNQGFAVVENDHRKLTEEVLGLKEQILTLRDENHQYEVDLAEANKTIQLREERLGEMRQTIDLLRDRLGYESKK